MTNPLITFALFSYNQERHIREAVEAALAQDYEPLEIILSDDCSTDQTYDVILEVTSTYKGPHKLVLNSNFTNLGLIDHVNKVAYMASGELIVVAAGDDISHEFRTSVLAEIFYGQEERPLLIHSPVEKISEDGKTSGIKRPPMKPKWHLRQTEKISVLDAVYIGASGAWSKDLFNKFGRIEHAAAYEDIVLGARAAMLGGLTYCPQPLLKYRTAGGMTTNTERFRSFRSFLRWRKSWITTMEDSYLQRIKDVEKANLRMGIKKRMMGRLELFSRKRKLYQGWPSTLEELRSNPLQSLRAILSEVASISAIFAFRSWSIINENLRIYSSTLESKSKRSSS